MNEDEIKEMYKGLKRNKKIIGSIDKDFFFEFAETVLNILEKNDKESHFIQSELDIANAKIIELNKIIDEMAKEIFIEIDKYKNPEEVKQYFERKVETEDK